MRVLPALLAVAAISMWGEAAGAAELTAEGAGEVREAAFAYDVRLEGVVAVITSRQTLVGTGDAAAVYTFALPADAAVVGLAITPPGGKAQRGVAVDATAAITPAADAGTVTIAPDLGLVRRLGEVGERDVAYELRVWPIQADAQTIAEVTWVVPLQVDDGRLTLRVPGRGGDDNLVSATGTVRVSAPAGVKATRELHADGELLAAAPGKKTWRFTAPRGELRIDVRPVLTGKPLVLWSTAPVGDDGGAVGVAMVRPREAAPAAAVGRVVIVVDVSPSAAAAPDELAGLVERIAEGLPEARFEVVGYDRAAHRLTTGFARTAREEAVRAAGDAVRAAEPRSGSDLVGGLAVAGGLFTEDGAAAERGDLVVVITDGVLPSDAAGAALDVALGGDATVSAVLLADDDGVLPAAGGPIHELVAGRGGHVVTLRRGEMLVRARALAGELAAPTTWTVTGVDGGAADLRLELTGELPAGGALRGFGWYAGAAPKQLRVETSGGVLTGRAARLPHLGALAVHLTPDLAPGVHGEGTEAADRASARLARRAHVVGSWTTLVAVDGRDELAAARAALAAKGGTFARMPPPIDEHIGEPSTVVVELAVTSGARYELDTAGRIRADLLSTQLLPAARRCQQLQLRKGGARKGFVALEIEIARGEVIVVRASASAGASTRSACVTDAAYALAVPSYTLDDPEAIYLIRYPLHFLPGRAGGDADAGATDDAPTDDDVVVGPEDLGRTKIEPPRDLADPLGELRERER